MQSLTDKHLCSIDRFQSFLKLTPLLAITLLVGIESQAVRQSSFELLQVISDICGDGDARAVSEFIDRSVSQRRAVAHKLLAKQKQQTTPCLFALAASAASAVVATSHGQQGRQSLLNAAFAHSVQIRAPSREA